jgi:hypothetical protein
LRPNELGAKPRACEAGLGVSLLHFDPSTRVPWGLGDSAEASRAWNGQAKAWGGLGNVLQNPTVSLFNQQGVLQSNDDWQSDQKDEIIATDLQPSNPAESAIVRTLMPGNYTAIVSGVNGATGIALVEVYGLN